ncbi:MAG TPA: DUF3857 domain-containing protein, partial [Chthoniobacteraceae bacterium]|nr:DUF3857 domain-containing protein [Chthoniobacteraceae bacterium]
MISPSHDSAQLVGMYIAVLLMTGFTVLSVTALRRRSANKKCVLSLTFLLGGWTIATLGVAISRQAQLGPVAQMISSLVFVVLVIASFVLGIIGLVEFSVHRGRYRRGRKRAIFALVLDGLAVTFAIAGAVRAASGRQPFSPIAGGAPAQPVAIEEWNFRLNPPSGWQQANAQKLNPLARVALTRTAPTAFFMVVTEKLPVGVPVNLGAAAEIIKGQLKANGGKFIEEPLRDHGLDGIRLETEAAPGGIKLYFNHWITQHRGIVYQLVTWGPPAARDALRAQSDKLRAGFEIIDRNRSAVPASARAKSVHASPQYGYAIDCRDTDWMLRWENLAKDLPDADYGVMNSNGSACLCVIPVWIGDGDPDLDALTHALAGRIGVAFPDDNIYGLKDWQQGKGAGLAKGRAFAFERNVEGTDLLYRLRVLRHLNFAYLLAAWFDKAHESRTDLLDEGLDRIYFAPPPMGPPPRSEMNDRALMRHGVVCNEIGLWHDRRGESEAAREWFGRALELGKPDAVVALNYAESTARLGKTDEALTFLDEQIAKFPGHAKLGSKRAEIQLQSGDSEAATKGLAALFESGFRDDAQFAGFIEMLCEKGDTEAAFAALDKYAVGKKTPALRRTRATVHQYRHEYDNAADILREVLKDSPGDAQAALMLADSYFGAERYGDTITECDKLIAQHRDSAFVYRRKGFAQLSLKRYREAKVSLEKAHEKSPADAELKRTLDYVSGLLGEGANTLVKKPLEPVAIPDDLLAEPPADKAAAYLAGFDAWYPQSVRAIEFVKGRELRTTERQVIKVVAQQGVEKFSTLEFRFDPLSEEIFVNSLSVKDADGKVIATGKADDSYVVDDGADAMATQGKVLHVPVPGLKPGCTLEFAVTRREVGSVEGFTFRPHLFSKAFPVLRSTLFVRAPHAAVKWEGTSGITAKKLDGALVWSVDQPAIYRWEPLQAPLETFSPMVWVADAGTSWQSEAKSYLGQIKDRLALDETVRAAAGEAIKGLRNEAEKTAALARFVQRELTYKAIEFGRRARMPNSAAQTLRNKYGDCKDHA